MDDIWEALESSVMAPSGAFLQGRTRVATPGTIGKHRRAVLRFLEEIPGDTTVQEIREALDSYGKDDR